MRAFVKRPRQKIFVVGQKKKNKEFLSRIFLTIRYFIHVRPMGCQKVINLEAPKFNLNLFTDIQKQ